jgi:anti-repressor protein
MTNIIKVTKSEIGNAELNSVNARDIHNYLQVNSKFADWIKRAIVKYDFKENIDFTVLKNEYAEKWEFSPTEYIVTMDMAKELAMLENNPKGKENAKYN